MIYIYGDSHAKMHVFSHLAKANPTEYKCQYRPGALAYNALKYVNETLEALKDVKKNDCIILSYGEVDSRMHIHKNTSPSKSYVEVIEDILQNYFAAIKIIADTYPETTISIFNVVPPKKDPFKTHKEMKGVYEFIGTSAERKSYVEHFNKQLKHYCETNNYIFFNIYDKLITPEGYMEDLYTDDSVHLLYNKVGKFYESFINSYIF